MPAEPTIPVEGLNGHPAASRPAPLVAAVEPLLVRAPGAARMCGMSLASWYRLAAAGRTPASLRLGGAVMWRIAELREWVAAGCPCRKTWEALRAAQKSGRPPG
jgi:predicted DNA-binding transcriptional regulator AlpA